MSTCCDCGRPADTVRCSACVAREAKEMSAKCERNNSPLNALLFQMIADNATK